MYKLAFPEYPSTGAIGESSPSRGITAAPDSNSFVSDIIFNEIKERSSSVKNRQKLFLFYEVSCKFLVRVLKEGSEYVKNVGGTYRFNVSKGKVNKSWTVDLTKEPIFVGERDGKKFL